VANISADFTELDENGIMELEERMENSSCVILDPGPFHSRTIWTLAFNLLITHLHVEFYGYEPCLKSSSAEHEELTAVHNCLEAQPPE
jgi:hypothetical protein